MEENTLPRKIYRPMSFSTAKELWDKADEYFRIWKEENRPYTIVGLTCFLDTSRNTLCEYEKGTYDDVDPEFSNTVRKIKDFIECHKWEGGLSGKYHAAFTMFDLKNNHGATDDYGHTGKNGESLPPSQTTIILTDKAIDEALQRQNEKY